MTLHTTPITIARELRDDTIARVEDAARALLLSEDSAHAEKATRALDAILTAAVDQVEALSTSNRGYAMRDLDDNVQRSLARARGFVSKLKTLHYLDREARS